MFCCCFYISCSVTAQQSLPNVVRLTQQCICVHKTVSVCERGRAYSKCHCTVFLKHLLLVCITASNKYNEMVCIVYLCTSACMCSADWGCSLIADGGRVLLLQTCTGGRWRVCWIKKQVDCMMQNYTDSMTYTWASFMHGAAADGTVLKHGLKPTRSIFYNS